MSADEFDCVAADDGMETREKGERPRWLHEWLPAHMNDGVRYCSKCGYAEGSLPDCPMSVDRGTPTPPRTVTGQSPREESFVVSAEAVEKAEEAVRDYWARADGITPMGEVRAALVAALPVIERDLQDDAVALICEDATIDALIEIVCGWSGDTGTDHMAVTVEVRRLLAARVREGGRA